MRNRGSVVAALGSMLVCLASPAKAADPTPGKNLFQLEIIAYNGNNCPQGDFIGTNRHQIAVKADVNDNPNGKLATDLVRQNDIMLAPGDFQVVDGNACIDGVARACFVRWLPVTLDLTTVEGDTLQRRIIQPAHQNWQ